MRLLEEGGYEAFTIAALCERAGVPPRALYARAATKDALFLAVYEHGMSRVLAGRRRCSPTRTAGTSTTTSSGSSRPSGTWSRIFTDNAAFLRAVVLISGAHPEVRRRGEAYRNAIGALFTAVLAPIDVNAGHHNPAREREFCFSLIFSAMVLHTAYGPGFGPAGDQEFLIQELVTMAQRYLMAGPPPAEAP